MNDEQAQNDSSDAEAMASNALEEQLFKLRKKIPEDIIEELDGLDEAGLRARIAQCDCNIHESEQAKEADEELKKHAEKLKEMRAPYAEVKKLQSAIIKYGTCLLDKQGNL